MDLQLHFNVRSYILSWEIQDMLYNKVVLFSHYCCKIYSVVQMFINKVGIFKTYQAKHKLCFVTDAINMSVPVFSQL